MQMMPIANWAQRVASEARSAGGSVCKVALIGLTPGRRVQPGACWLDAQMPHWSAANSSEWADGLTVETLYRFRGTAIVQHSNYRPGGPRCVNIGRTQSEHNKSAYLPIGDIGQTSRTAEKWPIGDIAT